MTVSATRYAEDESELAAFLRDIERRGFVLAQAQCADAALAQSAVIASKAAFHEQAASLPATQWPSLFWQLLLAQRALNVSAAPESPDALSRLGAGPRAALLLRLVAELDQAHGAEVLRVSPVAYRHALSRALETLQAQGIHAAELRVIRDHLQQQVKQATTVPRPTVPVRIAPTREPDTTTPRPTTRGENTPRSSSRLGTGLVRPVLIGFSTLLLAAFIATFFWKSAFFRHGTMSANGMETLGVQAPAATLSPTATAFAGPDFDLLADPQGEHVARDLDLYAWYAAGSNAPATNPGSPAPLPEASGPETSAPETDAPEGGGAQ